MRKTITQFFNIAGETNPLMVEATITAELEEGGWTWEVGSITTVEIVIGNKEGIDITRMVLNNPRAKALVTAQVADCEEQIFEALANHSTTAA